jgi:diguanylate cyclase (GGDEF)-like protein/PAS domain S-box-containing protein
VFFRRTSIRGKLFGLVIFNGTLMMLMIGVFLFGYEKIETREAAKRALASQAGIVADSSAAALAFSDERAAADTLKALRADSEIMQAAIYLPDGQLFASYSRGAELPRKLAGLPRGEDHTGDGYLSLSKPIFLGNQRTGTVFLKASLREADLRMRRNMEIVGFALLFSQALALLLGARMQRTFTRPIADLSRVARIVSVEKDYSARAVRYSEDEIGFLVDSFNHMLTQIQAREAALSESEERYALSARGSNDGLWDWKLISGEIYFSPRWNQMLGYPETETWQTPETWFERIHHGDRKRVKSEIGAHREGRTRELATEYRIRRRNGDYLWVLCRGIAVRDAEGTAVRIAGSQTDITKGKVADPLTGLPNRLYFLDRLENAVDARRGAGMESAVLFLDLDRFKLVNDSMGHAAGDDLLEGVAERLRESLGKDLEENGGEEVGHDLSFVARLGGDEFAILLNPIARASDPARLAERILGDLDRPFEIQGRQVFAGVSIGIALTSSGSSPEEVLRNADTAMYHAKTAGKSRFALFDDGMRQQAVQRLEIETELRKAIGSGEMLLHFQPQTSLVSRELTGFEALVRWKHPIRGIIPPSEFIPVAEETELIVPLGAWVLRESCRQMVEWQNGHKFDPPLHISVNVSFKQLTRAGFVEEVQDVLRETRLAPSCLSLEMTESAVMQNPEEAIETLRRLREAGIGLEIDDFGTGYSSLSHLSSLPFDTLKIDRSFVSGLGVREDSVELIRTILDLARSLNLDVIAEGVENEMQIQALIELGCPRAQGYYFSKPVAREIVPLLFEEESLKRSFKRLEQGKQPASAEAVSVPNHEDRDIQTVPNRIDGVSKDQIFDSAVPVGAHHQ